jgi:hypothetical protein
MTFNRCIDLLKNEVCPRVLKFLEQMPGMEASCMVDWQGETIYLDFCYPKANGAMEHEVYIPSRREKVLVRSMDVFDVRKMMLFVQEFPLYFGSSFKRVDLFGLLFCHFETRLNFEDLREEKELMESYSGSEAVTI